MRLILLAALIAALPARGAPLPGEERVPGHLLVRYRTERARLPEGARIERRLAGAVRLVHAEDDSEAAVEALALRLAADPDVEWAEPERWRRRTAVSANDPLFEHQWALQLARIPDAWARSTGSAEVVVAVLDSGIQPHPDLQPRQLDGWDFVTSDDNGGDGQPGRDADPTDPGTPEETSSALHGMHVAGVLGAHTDNRLGMAGVDWRCRILPVRVLGVLGGKGSDGDIADAIRWAAGLHVDGVPDNAHPAAVINLSFGGPGGSRAIQAAIDEVHARKVIVVAAAGNDGIDAAEHAPASLRHVIAVGAVDATGALAYYSNRGPRIDLVAPGGDLTAGAGIVSTLWDAVEGFTYLPTHGTSQAAPHVAGVAALMRAIDPTLDPDRTREILVRSADHRYTCAEGCGGGLLHADAALAAVEVGCADGHCVRLDPNGVDLVGGCGLGRRPAGAPGPIAGLLLLGLREFLRRIRGPAAGRAGRRGV